jgi:dodecin
VSGNVYAVSEVVGTSASSVDDAIRGAIARASKTVRNLDWFEVVQVRGHIEGGQVGHFQVTMKVGFRLESPS